VTWTTISERERKEGRETFATDVRGGKIAERALNRGGRFEKGRRSKKAGDPGQKKVSGKSRIGERGDLRGGLRRNVVASSGRGGFRGGKGRTRKKGVESLY